MVSFQISCGRGGSSDKSIDCGGGRSLSDVDGGGGVDYEELKDFCGRQFGETNDAMLRMMFKEADEDGSGEIELDEFVHILKKVRGGWVEWSLAPMHACSKQQDWIVVVVVVVSVGEAVSALASLVQQQTARGW